MRSRSSPTAKGASDSDHAPFEPVVVEARTTLGASALRVEGQGALPAPFEPVVVEARTTLVASALRGVVAPELVGVVAPEPVGVVAAEPRRLRSTATGSLTPAVRRRC